MTRIYTRTGDEGATDTFGGGRVAKDHPRVEAYGAVDELNSALGVAAAALEDPDLARRVSAAQHWLFVLGADLATPPGTAAAAHVTRVAPTWTRALETDIDRVTAELPPLAVFVLPGGTPAAAQLHVARAACRRAERCCVTALTAGEELSPEVVPFLNRMSDWLFTLARAANLRAGVPDVPWDPDAGPGAILEEPS